MPITVQLARVVALRAALAGALVLGSSGAALAAAPPDAPPTESADAAPQSSTQLPEAAPTVVEPLAAQPRFIVPDMTATGAVLPQDLDVGDFTSDGKPDVVVASNGPDAFNGGIVVLPGDGDGNLRAAIETELGQDVGGQDLAMADFNKDGKLDLAVQTGNTGGPGTIMVLLGTGAGKFNLSQQLSGGNGHVVAGELTGDGNPDIAFVYENGSAIIKFYTGKGDGKFNAVQTLDSLWDAYNFELADMNNDGLLDFVGASGPVWVMLNEGGGNFADPVYTLCDVLCIFEMTLSDFNGDGRLDLAGATGSEGTVVIAFGDGDGTFTPVETIEDVAFATGYLTSGDFTGDGVSDLIVANEYVSQSKIVILMKGRGDGTFGNWTYWTTGNDDPTPVDLNNDGKLDLVAFSGDPGLVYSTVNAGNGKFKAPQSQLSGATGSPVDADINADGLLDVVAGGIGYTGSGFGGVVTTYLNKGGAKFDKVTSRISDSSLESYDAMGQIKIADLNEDGKLDLVAGFVHVYPKSISVWVLFGNGQGKFSGLKKLSPDDNWVSNPAIAVGDVNADSNLDIVGQTNSQVSTWLGNGDGTFSAVIKSGATGSDHPGLLLADFTGDGKLDAASIIDTGTNETGSGLLKVNKGNGDGTFTLVQTLSYDGSPGGPGLAADLNADGRPDIALGASRGNHTGRSGIRVFLNTGGGSSPFTDPDFYPSPPYGLGDLDAADFDLDGDLDVSSNGYTALPIALNDGTGHFTGPATYIVPNPSPARVAADFTGDGKPDLFNINSTDRGLYSVYINRTPLR